MGTKTEKIVQHYNNRNNEKTALATGSHTVAIPEDPAFTDGIKRRLEVYNAIYEIAQAQYGRFGSALLTATTSPVGMAGSGREPELIQDIEDAKKDVEYVYH